MKDVCVSLAVEKNVLMKYLNLAESAFVYLEEIVNDDLKGFACKFEVLAV